MFSYPADLVGAGNPCAERTKEAGTLRGCSDPFSRYPGYRGGHAVLGHFRIKAQRLPSLAAHVIDTSVSTDLKKTVPTAILQPDLQPVNGIGGETAGSIQCNGFFRTGFEVDGSSEQILRYPIVPIPRSPEKALFEDVLPCDNRIERQTSAHRIEYPGRVLWEQGV